MRLIDADALMEDIKSNAYIIRDVFNSTDEGMSINGIQYAIDNAPTAVPPVTPTVKVQQADTLIIAAALQNFTQDSEKNISDRERAEELREQVLAYGASMCKPPTERTGAWIKSYFNEYCGTDENHNPVFRKTPCVKCDQCGEKRKNEENFCPNCGADMRGEK